MSDTPQRPPVRRPVEHPDDQIEHPDEGGGIPVSVDLIKATVSDRLAVVRREITEARRQRQNINDMIKVLRIEEAELSRVMNSFKPRARKPK